MEGVRVITFPRPPFGAAGVFFFYFLCCMHILLFKKFDVIHAHKTDGALFLPLLRLQCKVIATSHEAPYTNDKWKAMARSYFRLMEKVFVRSSAVLTAVSKTLSDHYAQTYQREVLYVPNGVEISNERNDAAAEDILEQHGVKGAFLFFAARRILKIKGLHTFLQAMKKINYQGTILIAGEEGHNPAYQKTIDQLSAGLDVRYIGFVNGMPTLMSLIERSKLFVFPSETEGLSLMLLEVGSTGQTPLLCSDIPQNTQVFGDEHVLYFRNKDVDDLAEKFLWAENHWDEMELKMKRARAHVMAEYSSEVVASRYDALFQKLVSA
jgi:glycosyltransferase involved in cell wall biosynthesis